ncbi:MAG: DUF3098 domain-containing protein [Bacteroidales bacterium]|jgi:cytochrome bd-type quinol oxidase subunit 2|nr:DUF3098 domain-containing protein [Bacteroidales bacterium]
MAKEIKNTEDPKREFAFVFNKINYIIMIAGIVLLALGYILLAGGGSDDPNVFNPEMFNGRRLYLAPILIILGLIVEIVAIMYRGKDSE